MSMQGVNGIMEHDVQLQDAVLKQQAWCQYCYTGRMKKQFNRAKLSLKG